MEDYMIIHENNFDKVRELIKKHPSKKIIFSSDNDELNRKILEKENITVLLLNQLGRRDFHKQRNSGFNHVLAKLAKKKDVTIGINLDEIIESKGEQKAEIISRIKQNINICNKNKLKMKFISKCYERDSYNLKSLGLILGMPTWMTKKL